MSSQILSQTMDSQLDWVIPHLIHCYYYQYGCLKEHFLYIIGILIQHAYVIPSETAIGSFSLTKDISVDFFSSTALLFWCSFPSFDLVEPSTDNDYKWYLKRH